jgi:hypothetical protein
MEETGSVFVGWKFDSFQYSYVSILYLQMVVVLLLQVLR